MGTRNLDRIFRPKRIAVIGASDTPNSIGAIALRNLIGEGFDRVVYPVNPTRESVRGIQAYPNIAALPKAPDLAVVCTPAETVPAVVAECGQAGTLGLLILSTGFREVGAEGAALEDRIRIESRKYPGMRIIGPNSFGIIVPKLNLNVSLAARMPRAGHVTFVSQSKALCTSTLDWALKEHVGFASFVSVGNALDVGLGDLIDYFGNDPRTLALILYVVSIDNVRDFMSAARAFARSKPIVAYKSSRWAEAAEETTLRTGAMVTEDAVHDAAFQRAGIVRVSEIDDLFDCAELLARQRTPRGHQLGIITNAGELGVVATDALLAGDGTLAPFSDETIDQLVPLVGAGFSPTNPAHLGSNATAEQYAQATQLVLDDLNVSAALVILVPRRATDPAAAATAVATVAAQSRKPVLAAWVGGQAVQAGVQVLNQAGVPVYNTPGKAVRAFMHLVSYAQNKEILYETPRDIPLTFTPDREKLRDLVPSQGKEVLCECLSKALLQAYDIPIAQPHIARSADEVVQIAHQIGFPVVLKVLSPHIIHRAEVGGVALNLATEPGLRTHFEQIVSSARRQRPDAHIEGVTVQKMIVAQGGVEMILGAKRDPTFGATIMVGFGGTAAEVICDRALGLPPLNERLTRRMLESLHFWPLLLGYRGRPRANIDLLIEILMRLSYLVADHPEIKELDINPLLVTPTDVVTLDASVRVDQQQTALVRPFAHLAIRPYPEEYSRSATLRDGTPVTLRPIKPEDVPGWQQLLAQCSDESIRLRFRGLFKRTSHEVATRYCFIDYDRDMAIVAEVEANGAPVMIGVCNLFGDPDHESAEYAILVADDWRRRGLGDLLTEYCVKIAKNWGLRRLYAETIVTNVPMISLFRKQGFQIERAVEDAVAVNKVLA